MAESKRKTEEVKASEKQLKKKETDNTFEQLKQAIQDNTPKPVNDKLAKITPKLSSKAYELPEKDDDGIEDESGIEDFYQDDTLNENLHDDLEGATNEQEELLDMDYSQTQLDDFLKSQASRGLSSHALLQSFVSTYNKSKNQKPTGL